MDEMDECLKSLYPRLINVRAPESVKAPFEGVSGDDGDAAGNEVDDRATL